MLNIKLLDKVSNNVLKKKTNFTDIVNTCNKKKWKWAGHIHRFKDDRWTKRIIDWSLKTIIEGKDDKNKDGWTVSKKWQAVHRTESLKKGKNGLNSCKNLCHKN